MCLRAALGDRPLRERVQWSPPPHGMVMLDPGRHKVPSMQDYLPGNVCLDSRT